MIKKELRDISFLIPIRIDSIDRLKNIEIIVNYINRYFDTNISVMESACEPLLPEHIKRAVQYDFKFTKNPIFKRTEINNQLISNCRTPIAIIYDSDVIISPEQLLLAINMIKLKSFFISLPYDGRFLEVDKYSKKLFEANLDIDFLDSGSPLFRINTCNSVGGCFVFDTEEYKKCGMDNENIIGWGHEDAERIKRLKKLGYSIFRPYGPLYHLYHSRQTNSYFFDDMAASRSFETYFNTCTVSKEDLQKEIKKWKWTK